MIVSGSLGCKIALEMEFRIVLSLQCHSQNHKIVRRLEFRFLRDLETQIFESFTYKGLAQSFCMKIIGYRS